MCPSAKSSWSTRADQLLIALCQITHRRSLRRSHQKPLRQSPLLVNPLRRRRPPYRCHPRKSPSFLQRRPGALGPRLHRQRYRSNQIGHRMSARQRSFHKYAHLVRLPQGRTHKSGWHTGVDQHASLLSQRRGSRHMDQQWWYGRSTCPSDGIVCLSWPIQHDGQAVTSKLVCHRKLILSM